jgi:hypothetical protein
MALINPQTGASGSIYDPTMPNRIVTGQQTLTPITSIDPGQGPQYNPSFGADASPQAPTPFAYPPSFPTADNYKPSFDANAPLSKILAANARPAAAVAKPSNTGPGGADMNATFDALPNNVFDGARNSAQTAQAPAPATPQGWNLFTALGQALGHLLGFNAQGQPQGMTGLVRNPMQTAATPPVALRMQTPAQQAARYQGRTLLG